MTTLCYYHPDNEAHDPGTNHSERSERLTAIVEYLREIEDPNLKWVTPELGDRVAISLAHDQSYIDYVFSSVPDNGYTPIEVNEVQSDDDGGELTVLCPKSGHAVLRSVGAITDAVKQIVNGYAHNAFCLTRPPGHHALKNKAMGFCVFANAVIAARYAQERDNIDRVAIVDFDVHHGNGTQSLVEDDTSIFFTSIHQSPLWPETGHEDEVGVGNILNIPVAPNASREEWLALWKNKILNRLNQEEFDLLVISAGFDAHKDDPKGSQNLESLDYRWIMEDLLSIAEVKCDGRTLALLEGGYDITASAESATEVINALLSIHK